MDINKALKEIKHNAQLPENFRPLHGLRHVFASILASSGKVNLHVISELLTHKSLAMTQRYAHLMPGPKQEASNVAGDIVSAATRKRKWIRKSTKKR